MAKPDSPLGTYVLPVGSANAGDPAGAYGLGVLYADGRSLPRDLAKSTRWMCRAAEQGFSPAQYNLGNAYLEGQGVKRDVAAAVDWWRKAARRGLAPACYNLGLLLSSEGSSAELREEGIAWFRRGAALGEPQAMGKLEALGESLLLAEAPFDPAREPQRSEGQIMTMDASGFTIQLFSGSKPDSTRKFISEQGLEGEALQFRFLRQGAVWSGVIYGWYPDRATGRSILAVLKPELAQGGAWLRPVAEVQGLILSLREREGTGRLPEVSAR